MSGKSFWNKWIWHATVLVCAISLFPAISFGAKDPLGQCRSSKASALSAFEKAAFACWSNNSQAPGDAAACIEGATSKLFDSWVKIEAKAEKSGVGTECEAIEEAQAKSWSTLFLGHLTTGVLDGIPVGRSDDSLAKSLFKAIGSKASAAMNAYSVNYKSPNTSKLQKSLSKASNSFNANWSKSILKGKKKGFTYSGMAVEEVGSVVDSLAAGFDSLFNGLTPEAPEGMMDIQLEGGLSNGATTSANILAFTGVVPNPAESDTEFGGRVVVDLNGVAIPASVKSRLSGTVLELPAGVAESRQSAKLQGLEPDNTQPEAVVKSAASRGVEWCVEVTLPIQFGPNTVQIRLYDLYDNLLAASQKWTIQSTVRPADLLATLVWNTNNTDVDLHSSSKALDGSYDYGYYHTYYSNPQSGYAGNMVLDIDNTWGYGPEHITVEKANPAGESVYFKVYYYSDHSEEASVVPSTATLTVQKKGKQVFSKSVTFDSESTASEWASGSHIWDVGELTIDPSDNYIVTVDSVNADQFPLVTLNVTVQGRDEAGTITGITGLSASHFNVINNNFFMNLTSVSGGAGGAYQLTYSDRITGKRPVFVYVSTDEGGAVRSGCSETVTYGKSYALLVGINDYKTISDLSFCVNDVNDLQAALSATPMFSGADTEITILADSAASKAGALAAIDAVKTKMKKEDLFLFHFSGHGSNGTSEDTQVLCLWDSNDSDYLNDISVDGLQTALNGLPYSGVTNVYVFLDACFSGNFIGHRAKGGNKIRFYQKPVQGPGTADRTYEKTFEKNLGDYKGYFVMTGATGTQSAWDVTELQNGLFSEYLLEALGGAGNTLGPANTNGDVMTSCEEVFAYVKLKVVDYSSDPANDIELQTPCSYDSDTDKPSRLRSTW